MSRYIVRKISRRVPMFSQFVGRAVRFDRNDDGMLDELDAHILLHSFFGQRANFEDYQNEKFIFPFRPSIDRPANTPKSDKQLEFISSGFAYVNLLSANGLSTSQNPGNSLCQFYSLAQRLNPVLEGDELTQAAVALRKEIGQWLLQNIDILIAGDSLANYFASGNGIESEDFVSYCENLQDPTGKDFGGHLTLLAFAHMFSTNVFVFRNDDGNSTKRTSTSNSFPSRRSSL